MVSENGYSLEIKGAVAEKVKNGESYAILKPGSTYALLFSNNTCEHTIARIYIGQEFIGDFYLPPKKETILTHPGKLLKNFKFVPNSNTQNSEGLVVSVSLIPKFEIVQLESKNGIQIGSINVEPSMELKDINEEIFRAAKRCYSNLKLLTTTGTEIEEIVKCWGEKKLILPAIDDETEVFLKYTYDGDTINHKLAIIYNLGQDLIEEKVTEILGSVLRLGNNYFSVRKMEGDRNYELIYSQNFVHLIIIKTLTGRKYPILVPKEATFDRFKEIVYQNTETCESFQRFIANGKVITTIEKVLESTVAYLTPKMYSVIPEKLYTTVGMENSGEVQRKYNTIDEEFDVDISRSLNLKINLVN